MSPHHAQADFHESSNASSHSVNPVFEHISCCTDNDHISAEQISASLDKLLDDRRLRISARNRNFLRFVVEETLAGRAERIKSYTIAVDVFGRAPTFDSITDPIVRIEATRLRAGLAKYYADCGADSDICIGLPKGSYVPTFHRIHNDWKNQPPRTGSRRFLSDFGIVFPACLIAIILSAAAMLRVFDLSPVDAQAGSPAIFVESVQALSGGEREMQQLAQGLTHSIVSSLSDFPNLRVIRVYEGRDSANSVRTAPLYVLQSSVRVEDGTLRFWWNVTDGKTHQTLMSDKIDYPRDGQLATDIEDFIASRIAATFTESYGVIGVSDPAAMKTSGRFVP